MPKIPPALSVLGAVSGDESAVPSRGIVRSFEKLLAEKDESFWKKRGEEKALRLFHEAAVRVPAYKDFLRCARVNHDRITTIRDFAGVPVTNAENYVAAYPVAGRCWDGRITSAQFVATSSGTKGEPKYWPRGAQQDFEATLTHEFLYRTYFQFDRRTTLLLIGFPMGVYVSGMATALPSWLASLAHPGLTIMSVGNSKAEMLRAVKNLSGAYEQTVLVGHPFFIKDVIETGAREGVAWSRRNIGMMFCSEGFTEAWRRHVARAAGLSSSSMRMFNTYGSSEMLLMAYETPMSIGVKRLLEQDQKFLKELTGDPVAPQTFQYNPLLRYIESVTGELVFTSASGLPLVRFNLHDRGTVFSLRHTEEVARACRKKIVAHFSSQKGRPPQLPLVALWGRSDHTVIFYAANIYPEHIKAGLCVPAFLRKLTGKFTMRKGSLKDLDEFLEINVELQPNVKPTQALAAGIQAAVVRQLEGANMEYRFLRGHLDKDIVPRIRLWPYGDAKYFKPGLKPRYIDPS
jgi:phenylacetate-CoA ligase